MVFLMGVTIRHFFNTHHAHKGYVWWTWGLTAALFAAIVWLSSLGAAEAETEEAALAPAQARFAAAEGFEEVADVVLGRCSMCHAAEPGYDGIGRAPRDVHLETPGQVAAAARQIYLQAGLTHAMPPGNLSFMEEAERALIRDWYRRGLAAPG
jgi:uncharacterized membrane protein